MSGGALNARLLSAAELVRQGAVFADIGTDHAYLPLFLLDGGKISRAVCADINEGPLNSARANAAAAGLTENIEFVLTDGAAVLSGKGITDYAICGMGGELIADIIDRAPHLRDIGVNLILQPMSRQEKLRSYLASSGFAINCESYSLDAGKYYVCMRASYVGAAQQLSELETITGPHTAEFRGREYRLSYLNAKLNSLERAYAGRRAAGEECCGEAELIAKLREYINKI